VESVCVYPRSSKPYRWTKWSLFTALLLTVPVPYFMVVIGGIVPAACLISLAVRGLFVAVPKFTAEGFWMLGILWAHVMIFGGLLYAGAVGGTWLLFRLMPVRYALLAMVVVSIGLFVTATCNIYRVPGHNSAPPANLLRILQECRT